MGPAFLGWRAVVGPSLAQFYGAGQRDHLSSSCSFLRAALLSSLPGYSGRAIGRDRYRWSSTTAGLPPAEDGLPGRAAIRCWRWPGLPMMAPPSLLKHGQRQIDVFTAEDWCGADAWQRRAAPPAVGRGG